MILAINYGWNETQSKWNAWDSVVCTYDVNGNNTMTIKYIWDWDNSQWGIFCRTEFTYDSYGNMTSSISDFGDEPLPPYVLGWNTKTNYYYSEHNITFIPETPEKQISVYPNPATDFIVFDLTNMSETAIVELFDVEGKRVLEQKLSENKQISVSNLPKGLYMYKLINSGIIYTGKLVVE